jgi:hypothetical protein
MAGAQYKSVEMANDDDPFPTAPTSAHEGTHAMVMIGSCVDNNERPYMLLSWCEKMPLVLVSFQ